MTICYLINRISFSVLQNKILYSIMCTILIYSLCLQRFLGLFILSIIIVLIIQNLIQDFLKGIFLATLNSEMLQIFLSIYSILSADVIFFESKHEMSTSPSASEDNYNYMLYGKHYSIVVSSHLKI